MPSSFDHCNSCAFQDMEAGDRQVSTAEHVVIWDLLHGRSDGARAFEKILGKERLHASQECARMILEGNCHIYQVNEEHKTVELIEREE